MNYMNQAEKREYLIRRLLDENGRYDGMEVPADAYEQKRMLRSLMNIRRPGAIDAGFLTVQNEGWYSAARRYEDFLQRHRNGRILLLELGVGGNTPGIIKVPFLRMAAQNPKTTYACLNLSEAFTISGLEEQSILFDADIGKVLSDLR